MRASGMRGVSAARLAVVLSLALLLSACDPPKPDPAPAPPVPAPQAPAKADPAAAKPAGDAAPEAPKADPVAAAAKAVQKAVPKDVPLPADLLQMKAEAVQAAAQVDMTTAKLEILAGQAGGDLDDPYEAFTESMDKLQTEAAGLKKRGDDMRERGAAYFQAWETQLANMTTSAVKDVATRRKDELSKAYTDVLARMQEGRAAYDAYIKGLTEIRTALDEKLDADRLKSLAGPIGAVTGQGKTLKARVDAVLAEIDEVAVIYTKP